MSETNRILDLDAVQSVQVNLGGKQFTLTQQRRAVLEKILRATQEFANQEGSENKTLTDGLFENWDKTVVAFAAMFGYEYPGTTDTDAVITHLNENLTVPAALKIFETWWELNGVQDFFDRGGRLTMPPDIVTAIREERQRVMREGLTPNSKRLIS